MKRPRVLNDTPRGGWVYTQPESGMTFRENHPKALQAAVWSHRLSLPDLNMQTGGGWEEQFWHDYCEQNPQVASEEIDAPRYFPNLSDIWNFLQTLWNWKRQGGQFVTQEEAERRANICLTGANGQPCPHNEQFAPCLGCRGISSEVEKLIEGRRTSQDQKLFVCTACGGCHIPTKLHFPLEAIVVSEEKLPAWCWQRKTAS